MHLGVDVQHHPDWRRGPSADPIICRAWSPYRFEGIEQLRELVGHELGPTEWFEVTQEDVDKFADVSRDDQWIHVDRERAAAESPYGTTVAHGNLTLSLIDYFRPAADPEPAG